MDEYLPKLLYTRESVLPKYLCEYLINLFEDNVELHTPGEVSNGINLKYRKVTNYGIPKRDDDWFHMESLLYFIVNRHLYQYLKTVHIEDGTDSTFILPEFNMVKYLKNSDYYRGHNDFHIDYNNRSYRYATFIIYLNTVTEGGNTIFWNTHKEKPISGKIVFFPSHWTFQHQGEMPISNDKYIITGWLEKSH